MNKKLQLHVQKEKNKVAISTFISIYLSYLVLSLPQQVETHPWDLGRQKDGHCARSQEMS